MNKTFFILLFYSLNLSIFSQWYNVYQSQNNYSGFYRDLTFLNLNTGYLACEDSAILKTTNGGLSWFTNSGTSGYRLSFIQFTSPNTGYSFGNVDLENSVFLKTTNEGSSWNVQSFNFYFTDAKFLDDNIGFVSDFGGRIHKTTNGGQSWISVQVNPNYLNSMDFINENIGFASATFQKFFKTSNGGLNWQQLSSPELDQLDFVNENTGYGINITESFISTKLYKTTNGGINWSVSLQRDSIFLGTPCFINENTGWIGGAKLVNGSVFRRVIFNTKNGGYSWNEQSTGYIQTDSSLCIGRIVMLDTNNGYASSVSCEVVGSGLRLNPIIFKTTNGGGDPIGIINHNIGINGFKLHQNYPNPFNPETVISYEVPKSTFVIIKLFDAIGLEIKILFKGNVKAGYNEVSFDGKDFSSGVYFYKIEAGKFVDTKKMVLIK